MPRSTSILPLLLSLLLVPAALAQSSNLAPTPPMGWNSWDAYGFTITETEFKANATVLASLKQYGWQYAVIDEGWYLENPLGKDPTEQKFVYDANGRLIPALNRFPDAADGAGLKPLADWVHAQGLKFGIHLIRGIPRQSVKDNKPIANSAFTAQDAGDPSDTCPWNQDNYGIKDNAAGQAWYDSILALYAGWGIDYLKIDCISDRPYKASEIRQVAAAIQKTGRPIVLSLSPGPTNLSHAEEVAKYAQMWRISDDHWDVWSHDPKTDTNHDAGEFPMGTRQAFDRLAAWQSYVKPGSWPDEDMLPIGWLGPHPGWGEARQSRFTHDEEQTEFTLWCITRSPLILGGNLTKLDDFTKSLLSNQDAIHADQKAIKSGFPSFYDEGGVRANRMRYWWAVTGGPKPRRYLAVFNLTDKKQVADSPWSWFKLADNDHAVYDVWKMKHIPTAKALHTDLEPHGCALFLVE